MSNEEKSYLEERFKAKTQAWVQAENGYKRRPRNAEAQKAKRQAQIDGLMGNKAFSTKERLKQDSLIKNLLDKGIFVKSRSVDIYILRRHIDPEINRCAFLCKKKLFNKKKVLRNRIRRVIKEAYRQIKYLLPTGYDIIILASNITAKTKSSFLEQEVLYAIKKAIDKHNKVLS